jgi:ATP-dependent Clp protease adaptor protein ClpS
VLGRIGAGLAGNEHFGGKPGFRPWRSTPPGVRALQPATATPIYTRGMAKKPDSEREHEYGVMVETSKPEVLRPPLYQVVLLNDDFTPMDFVVEVLQVFFALNREKATQIMLHVHTRGKGVCGVYTREVAESKVTQVNEFSRIHQHPLLCSMEKA